jgi:hypothetical protein
MIRFKTYILSCLLLLSVAPALYAQQAEKIYLSGTGFGDAKTWDFYCTSGRKSGYWTNIRVPSCWEQEGFGNYNYGRDYKTFGKNYRFHDEEGIYKKNFFVPASWKNKEIAIVFEGSMTDTEVKINGKTVGPVHRGAFYQFSYAINNFLIPGKENRLEVIVSKMSSDKSVNNAERLADYWVFGGIYRPVYLEIKPAIHIARVAIQATADGAFMAKVNGKGFAPAQQLHAVIYDNKGKLVAQTITAVNNKDSVFTLQTKLQNPLTWTSETPNLYTVQLQLKNAGKLVYSHAEKFGFRTIEVKPGQGIFINGVQVKMKGVNRHCFWPESGRTLNDAISLQDVLLLKQMNMNAVRCSHYPPDKKFLQYCDSLGIYVINELAGWQKAYSTAAGEPLVKEMVLRDRNHPSVIFWANGNEGGTNKSLDAHFSKWDLSQRPVIHPHHRPGNAFNYIDNDHYEDYISTQKKLQHDTLIYMPTEMLHAQDDGGGGAAMYDFWELHWNSKMSGGVFIWAMVDEAIQRTDFNNRLDANGLNANDGILGPYREKEGSYYALREIFSPVQLISKNIAQLTVQNRYHFTNLNACTFKWQLINYNQPFTTIGDTSYTIKQKGSITAPDIAPGKTGILPLQLPSGYTQHDALILSVNDKQGKEIYAWHIELKQTALVTTAMLNTLAPKTKQPIVIQETDSIIRLSAADISITLDKLTGLLAEVVNSKAARLSFNNGPLLINGQYATTGSVIEKGEDSVTVRFNVTGTMKSLSWTIYHSGWVQVQYAYNTNGGAYNMAGVSFSYPENYILSASWLGKGPTRQWRNRIKGTEKSVYQNQYNNTQTGYSPVQYPEFKGYYGDISWMQFNTVEGSFLMAAKEEELYVRLFNFYGLTGVKGTPELPPGDISFMDIIPAVGTKLALGVNNNTTVLGPQGQLPVLNKPVSRSLFFYFGTPETGNKKETYSRPVVDEVF